jgi:tRNA(Ile)-lysidine synthase
MPDPVAAVLEVVRPLAAIARPIVLAVSGGVDSMVLLRAVAVASTDRSLLCVATFDHRTGRHSRRTVQFVTEYAAALGVTAVTGRAAVRRQDEAGLREERWRFLHETARARGAAIATGHTRDDQIETVAMRILRNAGARGLAGLCAPSAILRPILSLSRAEVLEWARRWEVPWLEDPTNATPRYFRNRVRGDLLPALRTVRPAIDDELWDLGQKAASLREEVDRVAGQWVESGGRGRLVVRAELLSDLNEEGRALVWPSLLARAGVIPDGRAIRRLAALEADSRVGTRVPLSGGYEVLRRSAALLLTRPGTGVAHTSVLSDELRFGRFRFARITTPDENGHWGAWVTGASLEVRAWRPGDRVAAGAGGAPRRVKRFLAEAGIPSSEREGWPVVVQSGEITWVPGVCRVHAATARSVAAARYFACELVNR